MNSLLCNMFAELSIVSVSTVETSSSTTNTGGNNDSEGGDKGLTMAQKVGIIVAALLFMVLLGLGLMLCELKMNKRKGDFIKTNHVLYSCPLSLLL